MIPDCQRPAPPALESDPCCPKLLDEIWESAIREIHWAFCYCGSATFLAFVAGSDIRLHHHFIPRGISPMFVPSIVPLHPA